MSQFRAIRRCLGVSQVDLERAGRAEGCGMTEAVASEIDAKRLATLTARAALAGFELKPLPDGSFTISRWGMFRELPHAAAVEQFLQRASPRSTGG